MTCRHTQSLLEDFLDGVLSESDASDIKQHLDQCRSCRQNIEEVRKLKEHLQQLPVPQPGDEYFDETTRLILARTGQLNRLGKAESYPSPTNSNAIQLSEAKTAFLRSVASFAIAVVVLVSAVYIGTQGEGSLTNNQIPQSQFYVSVDLTELQNADNENIVTIAEQNRIARGMLLMGAPGSLGRGPILNQMLQSIE